MRAARRLRRSAAGPDRTAAGADEPEPGQPPGHPPGGRSVKARVRRQSRHRQPWNCSRFEELTPAHFEHLATLDTELIIFGSGNRNRFPNPAWLQPLMARRLGLETMDTAAACRTYNILAGEGRNVVAALILETGT